MKDFFGLTAKDLADIERENEEWWQKVEAGMPRCQYGNEGGPCRNTPEDNGWCKSHQHVPRIHAYFAGGGQ